MPIFKSSLDIVSVPDKVKEFVVDLHKNKKKVIFIYSISEVIGFVIIGDTDDKWSVRDLSCTEIARVDHETKMSEISDMLLRKIMSYVG